MAGELNKGKTTILNDVHKTWTWQIRTEVAWQGTCPDYIIGIIGWQAER